MLALAAIGVAAAAAVAVAVATEALGDDNDGAAHAVRGECGSRTAAVLARVDGEAARRIYLGEVNGHEVSVDAAHVVTWQPLLQALAAGDRSGVAAAVHQLVYMPRWHIVRLRVLQAGRVLADVGGPYVTVPVQGVLNTQGGPAARYVMSVQDDLGYEKLVSRFIGVPIDLYRGGRLLMGTLPVSSLPRPGEQVTVAGRSYRVRALQLRAFPTGSLAAVLLVGADASLQRAPCGLVETRAWGSIAQHIAARFGPVLPTHYADLVDIVRSTTGGFGFVLAGRRELAGGAVPRVLPTHGYTRYRGRTWLVYSWTPSAGRRVYVLAPPRH